MKKQVEISEIDIVYKKKYKSSELPKVTSSTMAHELLRSIWSDKIELYEEFFLIVLNRTNKCLGWIKLSQGGISGTVVENRLIIAIAIKAAASGIIIAHNHPSGEIKPSESDIKITKRLMECCNFFDIKLLDHIILSRDTDTYYSFGDEGILF